MDRRLITVIAAGTCALLLDAAPATASPAPSPSPDPATNSALHSVSNTYFAELDQHRLPAVSHSPSALLRHVASSFRPGADDAVQWTENLRTDLAKQGLTARKVHVSTTLSSIKVDGSTAAARARTDRTTTWSHPSPGVPEESESVDDHIVHFENVGGSWVVSGESPIDTTQDPAATQISQRGPEVDPGPPSSEDQLAPKDLASVDPAKTITGNEAPSSQAHPAGAPPGTNYKAMSDYATKWANRYNPNYSQYPDDCTNFVSQALRAGNWPLVEASIFQYTDDHKWDYNILGLEDTYSWTGAKHLENFTRLSNRTTHLGNIWNGRLGDLLFTDWDPNDKPDGHIDHVMMVTGYDAATNMPFVSQHTPGHRNIPLSEEIENAHRQGKTITWYGRRT